ncbi:MAG: hypothetical protein LBQ40_05025 [Clostridiales bacterium]|jgi:hypothetical protein|nr:hypothetical protein [Clostridiales bacterium]
MILRLLLPLQTPLTVEFVAEPRYSECNAHNQQITYQNRVEIINAIKQRYEECRHYGIIEKEFGITYPTIKKYLSEEVVPLKVKGFLLKMAKSIKRKDLFKLLYDKRIFDLPMSDDEKQGILKYLIA